MSLLKILLENSSWLRYVLITIIIVSTLSLGYTYLYSNQKTPLKIGTGIGEVAPDFTLKNLQGETFSLSSYRGKIVLIDFMSTTCFWCTIEMPELVEFYDEYRSKDLVFLSLDVWPETENQLQKFKEEFGAEWVFAAHANEVALDYKVSGIPVKYMLDKKGVIVWKQGGASKYSVLSEEIDKLL